MKKSLTKIIFINFLVFLISITVIEIFFGFWFSEHNFGPYMREHRLKKNHAILTYNGIQYNYIYKRNYHGFRGEEIDPSQIEAVIIGGSTTDERYKPSDFTITENLNLLLKKNGYDFKIINAGIEGQSTYGHIYIFKHWFTKLENFFPKLYIFYIGLNDYRFDEKDDAYYSHSKSRGDGHVKNPDATEVFFDTLKSSSFFVDKIRKIKQKYYTSAKTVKYDHDEYLKNLNNYKYINHMQALELHDVKKLKEKHQIIIARYLSRVKRLNNYAKEKNAVAVFINQVRSDGLKDGKLFIHNHSLIEYCNFQKIYCIDLASKLNGKFDYWADSYHTTGLGSKVIAETVIGDLIKIIKKEKLF